MATLDDVKALLRDVLQLGEKVKNFNSDTPLFGALPEFDSMAVVAVVTALEEKFDFVIEDDEIVAEVFETLASLTRFVEQKRATD